MSKLSIQKNAPKCPFSSTSDNLYPQYTVFYKNPQFYGIRSTSDNLNGYHPRKIRLSALGFPLGGQP